MDELIESDEQLEELTVKLNSGDDSVMTVIYVTKSELADPSDDHAVGMDCDMNADNDDSVVEIKPCNDNPTTKQETVSTDEIIVDVGNNRKPESEGGSSWTERTDTAAANDLKSTADMIILPENVVSDLTNENNPEIKVIKNEENCDILGNNSVVVRSQLVDEILDVQPPEIPVSDSTELPVDISQYIKVESSAEVFTCDMPNLESHPEPSIAHTRGRCTNKKRNYVVKSDLKKRGRGGANKVGTKTKRAYRKKKKTSVETEQVSNGLRSSQRRLNRRSRTVVPDYCEESNGDEDMEKDRGTKKAVVDPDFGEESNNDEDIMEKHCGANKSVADPDYCGESDSDSDEETEKDHGSKRTYVSRKGKLGLGTEQSPNDRPLSRRRLGKRNRAVITPDHSGESDEETRGDRRTKRTYNTRKKNLATDADNPEIDDTGTNRYCLRKTETTRGYADSSDIETDSGENMRATKCIRGNKVKRYRNRKKYFYKSHRKRNPYGTVFGLRYQFICCSCHGVFLSYHDFMNHVDTEGNRMKNVANCDETSCPDVDEKDSLDRYECRATDVNFLCAICGKVEETFDSFVFHVDEDHPTSSEISKQHAHETNSGSCLCHFCGKMLINPMKLAQHVVLHRRNYACEYCDYIACNNKRLGNHIIVRHPEAGMTRTRVKCDICGEDLCSRMSLHRHVERVHLKADSGPHQCSTCGKIISSRRGLLKHMDEVHSERKFRCEWENCDKIFKSSRHLAQHIRIHTGEKPFQCSLCDYSCSQKASLNWHFKSKHPGKPVAALKTPPLKKKVVVPISEAKKYIKSLYSTTVDMLYACHHCAIKCKTANNLAWHLKSCHSVTVEPSSLTPIAPSEDTRRKINESQLSKHLFEDE